MVAAPSTTIQTDQLQAQQLHAHISSQQPVHQQHVGLEESETHSQLHQKLDEDIDCVLVEDETIETDEIIEEDEGADTADVEYYPQTDCEESDEEAKQLGKGRKDTNITLISIRYLFSIIMNSRIV